mgnify:CR=1 FL=1
MDYSKLSDFEINKRVAEACGFLVQEMDDRSSLGMTPEFHEEYPAVVWVADIDCSTGQQCEPWWQFDPCNDPSDAWPIIVENKIGLQFIGVEATCGGDISRSEVAVSSDKNPLRAAMIVYLMMQDSNPSTLQSEKQGN